jgi:hypothetical protein
MVLRQSLQQVLEAVCGHVYFQPPANVQMTYPAIVYERDRADSKYADNKPYSVTKKYQVTLVSRNPDESIFEALAALPMCAHESSYVADNLNHDVFSMYF